ncbi:transmembrane channel-like protein 7 [Pollicipes pollicipes]|uniref:transmembrane channel-like protein 7 n=1 Tax=Pollicipes pollicipes TaxID=41117 RepID=UPI001884F2BE|nr:transmembrane channel-like protein 7 [Pollicipes pollicipes]
MGSRYYNNAAFEPQEVPMRRDASVPTAWVAMAPPAEGWSSQDGDAVEMEECAPTRGGEEFYQHGRQYSSFTQTLLRGMPSRSANGTRTLRRRRGSGSDRPDGTLRSYHGTIRGAIDVARGGDDVDAVVDAIQEGEGSIADANMAREVELNTLREMARPLAYKRQVKQRLEQRDRHSSRRVGLGSRMASSAHYSLVQARRSLGDLAEFLKLWKGHLQRVRGQLGSGVATYFQFLESLFYMNLATVVIVVGFLLAPQLLLRSRAPRDAFASYYGVPPNQTDARLTPYGGNDAFNFGNLFTGQGWLVATELFYGFYYRGTLALMGGLVYHMPHAYFFTVTLCLALQLCLLAVVTVRLYRANFIDAAAVSRNVFFNKVLCSWDFSIASEKMAALRHRAIFNELQEMTCDAVRELKAGGQESAGVSSLVWPIRILVNTIVTGVLVGVGFLTHFLLQQQQNVSPGFVRLAAFSVVVTVMLYVLPYAFSALARLELYSQQRYQVYVTLARTIMLEVVILGVTVGFWLDKRTGRQCWENELGQVLYQLVIMEFLFTIAFSFVCEVARNQLFRAGLQWLGRPQFELANNTMFLVYAQSLVWLGLYFSPLLCVIGTIKLFCSFYVKKFTCLSSCEPAANTWRAAQTRTVFQLVGFVSMIASMVAVGVVVFRVRSSSGCGPFQQLRHPWQVVTDILNSWHPKLLHYLSYITAPGVVVYITLVLGILVYFGRNVALTHQRRAAGLRGQLLLEGQDKRLLLRMIDEESRRLRATAEDVQSLAAGSEEAQGR